MVPASVRPFAGPPVVRVWLADPERVLALTGASALLEVLSAGERDRYAAFQSESRRNQHLVSRALLRAALTAENPDIAARDWVILVTERGKPQLASGGALALSVSHTDARVAVALTRQHHVGLDIEWKGREPRAAERLLAIARRFFSAAEAVQLERLSGNEAADFFFRRWTMKEAYAKCLDLPLENVLRRDLTEDRPPEAPAVQLIEADQDGGALAVTLAVTGTGVQVECLDGHLLLAGSFLSK
jgi:phosphopantetheine--protein transferase-like protein